jgi:hypothetical protein
MADIRSKSDLLASIRSERAALDAVVARVGDRLTEPGLDGERSVKDVLAHISAWEKIAMALVRNNQPLEEPPPGETGASADPINDKVFEDNKARSVADVLAESKRTHSELVALVEEMSEDQLTTPLGAGLEGAEHSPPAAAIVRGNSDEHYREHTEQIETWLREHPN